MIEGADQEPAPKGIALDSDALTASHKEVAERRFTQSHGSTGHLLSACRELSKGLPVHRVAWCPVSLGWIDISCGRVSRN